MKTFKYLFALFLIILSIGIFAACNNKKNIQNVHPISNNYYSNSSHYVDGQDYQYMYFTQGEPLQMAESKTGYYFLSGEYIYYADKKNMKPVILCNKPNCLHDRETDPTKVDNCNAFVCGVNFLAYYDGNLYATCKASGKQSDENELIKISLDGTKRTAVLKFDSEPNSLAIHRGKVYYTETVFDKNQKAIYGVKEFDLKNIIAKPHDIYTGTLQKGDIQDLECYDNNLYFTEFGDNGKITTTRVMRYDILSGKISRMFTNDDAINTSAPIIYDNKLYYQLIKNNIDGSIKEMHCFTCDLDGRNAKETFNVNNENCHFLSDEHYLYVNSISFPLNETNRKNQVINIVDKNGKIVDSIKTSSFIYPKVVCGGDDYLFIRTMTEDKFEIFYADKKQFGSGKITLKPFFQIDRKRMTPNVEVKTGEDNYGANN
jgi:hypothetical protein